MAKVVRFVFKELKDGDLLKFNATSAVSGTGGGARDQRFSLYQEFDPVFAAIFPGRESRNRKMRDGTIRLSTIYFADVAVHIDDTTISGSDPRVVQVGPDSFVVQKMRFWPPTANRGTEGRLTVVSKLRLNPPIGQGRIFLLLFDDCTSLSPRIAFVTENSIIAGQWEKSINDFFKNILSEPPGKDAVMGYKDLVNNQTYVKAS